MYKEHYDNLAYRQERFMDCVRDDFSRSIVSDVFEPMLSQLRVLISMEELMVKELQQIDLMIEELSTIVFVAP